MKAALSDMSTPTAHKVDYTKLADVQAMSVVGSDLFTVHNGYRRINKWAASLSGDCTSTSELSTSTLHAFVMLSGTEALIAYDDDKVKYLNSLTFA